MLQKKLRIGLIFGGRSSEHEVSLASATSVMEYLDKSRYEILPLGITREGRWLPGITPPKLFAFEQALHESVRNDALILEAAPSLSPNQVTTLPQHTTWPFTQEVPDVVFPVMHGSYGEDGALQGLLEMVNVPYVGCGVMGSALGMDKEKTKTTLRAHGLPTVESLAYRCWEWERRPKAIMDEIEQKLRYPCFIKPANSGSSIGIHKVHDSSELKQAIDHAAEYDRKIICERAIPGRELQCAVQGNHEPQPSVIGEVITDHEFYDYEAKYNSISSHTVVPAPISEDITATLQSLAIQVFLALDLSGLARIDFFLDEENDHIYVNEVNTLPSFTPQCMYARLCAASGLSYPNLLDRLIELALERHADRQRSRTTL